MEAIGMSAIAIIAVFMTQGSTGINELIPTLGAMALGAQRLLPSMQNSYSSWSVMQGNKKSLQDVLAILNMPLEFENQNINHKPLNFYKNIFIENLSFKYANNSPVVLKDININIKKGENIGLVGETGSGKSTLIDILMGLLNYYSGHIKIDGEIISEKNRLAWQKNIAHVPQSIFLSDSSIKNNIAFGVTEEKSIPNDY